MELPHPLELYRWSVQDPWTQARVLQAIYRRVRPDRKPFRLREDFAGNAADSVAWVSLSERHEAVAVDLDQATLAWAEERAARLLEASSNRLHLVNGNVLQVGPSEVAPADVLSVLNFSLFYFHQRAALREYLRHAHACLDEHGILVLNAFGGAGAMRLHTEHHSLTPQSAHPREAAPPPFEYLWEQRSYDAVANRLDAWIHFRVPTAETGEMHEIRDAFHYDWRLWTLPELTELLAEAGFSSAQVWRHTYDPEVGPSSLFFGPVTELRERDPWVAYVVGVR